jgi:chromosome segregation ATPase
MVSAATGAVARWTSEVEFDGKYKAFVQQRSAAKTELATHEEQHATLQAAADETQLILQNRQAELAGAKAALAKNDADYKAAVIAIAAAKTAQASATEAKNASNNNVNLISEVIAKLSEAVVKADESLAIAKDDAMLIAAVSALKTAAAEKTKQVETAKADLVAKTQAEQNAIGKVADSEKAAAGLLAMQEPLKKEIADRVAAMPSLEMAAAVAKQAADAYAPNVADSKERFDEISHAIATLQGLAQAG